MGRLFLKLLALLSFAVTGLFSFYLVVINFLDHLEEVSKAVLFFQLGCSILLAASGTIVFYRLKLAAIVAIVCQLGLLTLWMNFKPETGAEDALGMLQRDFPIAYGFSCLLSVVMLFLKSDVKREDAGI